MKYLFVLSLFFILNKDSFCQVKKKGDKFGGIVKVTIAVAKNSINGIWNAADKTGNASIDATLNDFFNANNNNPGVIAALESSAAEVKSNPEKFINPDGSLNKDAFKKLITSKLAGIGNITMPSNVLVDSNTNRGMRGLEY